MPYKTVREIGAFLYVCAAARIDTFYCPPLTADILWLEERKRHHKRLWMRLMRRDFLFARRTLNQLLSDYDRHPYDPAFHAGLDESVLSTLSLLINSPHPRFEAVDQEDARQLIKSAADFFERSVDPVSQVEIAA